MVEWMYRTTYSWPWHYLEVKSQLQALGALPPGKESLVFIGKETGWVQEPVWETWGGEPLFLYRDSNSDPSVVQPVASRYTDCAILAPGIRSPLREYCNSLFAVYVICVCSGYNWEKFSGSSQVCLKDIDWCPVLPPSTFRQINVKCINIT